MKKKSLVAMGLAGVKKGTVGWASVESVLLCHNGQ